MSPRPPYCVTLKLEQFEERLNLADTDPVTNLVGGSAALSSLIATNVNFQQGFNNTQGLLNALGGQSDIQHVILDTQIVFNTLYGSGAYLEAARMKLGFSLHAISLPTATSATISNFGSAAQSLAYAAGAAYAVEQDLIAHGIPAIGTLQSLGSAALQKVENAAIATYNSVVSIMNTLNHLSSETAEQAMGELSTPLVPPFDPTLTTPVSPLPVSPPHQSHPPVDNDGDNGDDFDGDNAFY